MQKQMSALSSYHIIYSSAELILTDLIIKSGNGNDYCNAVGSNQRCPLVQW